jgi:hypothetical protein
MPSVPLSLPGTPRTPVRCPADRYCNNLPVPFLDMDDATGRDEDEIAWLQGSRRPSRTPDPRGQGGPVAPAPADSTAGSLESFAAVVDALAAERGTTRAEIVRRMIEELEQRIVVDRDALATLRRLERHLDGPAPGRVARRDGTRT